MYIKLETDTAMRLFIILLFLSIVIVCNFEESYAQDSTIFGKTISDSTFKILVQSLNEQRARSQTIITESERTFEIASKIIDWSAMYFALLVVFLGIAGWIGMRRFNQIDKNSKEIASLYEKMQMEFLQILKYRDEIQNNIEIFKKEIEKDRKQFMEIMYLMTRGEIAFESGNLTESIRAFEKIILLKPDFADAYFMLGSSYSANGQYGEAISHFNKAIELRPTYSDAYYNLGRTHRRAKNWEASVENLKIALDLNPKLVRAAFNLGHTYLRMGDFENAMRWYRISTTLDQKQDYSLGHLGLGRIALKQDDKEEALKCYRSAEEVIQKIDKKRHWNFYHLGEIYLVLDKTEQAELYYKRALELNSALETLRSILYDLEFLRDCPTPPESIEKFIQWFCSKLQN